MQAHRGPGRRASVWTMLAGWVLVGLAIVGCGDSEQSSGTSESNAATSERTTTLRVAYVQGFGTLPIHIAETQGYFKRHGLAVKAQPGTNVVAFAPALGHQYDVVMSTPVDFLTAASRGLDIKAFSGVQNTTEQIPNTPLMTKDPKITSAADVVGKTVGVPSLTGSAPVALLYLIKKAGKDPKSTKLVVTPFPNQLDQLKAGRLDAAVSAIPFTTAMEAQGYRKTFDPVLQAGGGDVAPSAFFSTTSDFAQKRGQALAGFKASLQEAIDWIGANEAEARKELAAWLKLPPVVAQNAPLPSFDTNISVDLLAPFVPVVEEGAGVKNVPDPSSLVITPQ